MSVENKGKRIKRKKIPPDELISQENSLKKKKKRRPQKQEKRKETEKTLKTKKETFPKQETLKKTKKATPQKQENTKPESKEIGRKEIRPPTTTLMQDIYQLLIKIVIVCVAFALVFTFLFGLHRVRDNAMEPAMQDGDLVLFYRLDKRYVASDTLMLRYEGGIQVRRVVAVAGDVVDVTEEGVLINGSRVQEQGIYEDTLRYTDGVTFPITVGEGQVFVLGDNRTDAIDGRMYGAIDIDDTLGKVMTILRRRNI